MRSTRDAAGLATSYNYDAVRRLKQIAPPGVSPTDYAYVPTSGMSRARAEATSGTGDLQLATTWEFDPFGRISVEKQKMPDGSWSGRETIFDSAGRMSSVSELLPVGPPFANTTSYLDYDVFGRVGRIRTADAKETTFSYTGSRLTTRSYEVATGTGDRVVSVEEEFDRAGRLTAVTEDASGSATRTEYSYDPANRLTKVHWPGGAAGQDRTFAYDGRGFLTSEIHPESGATSYLYDGLGNVIERVTPVATLRSTYDRAGRLTLLRDTAAGDLKELSYDRTGSGTDYSMGKIAYGLRHNRSAEFGDVVVKEIRTISSMQGTMRPAILKQRPEGTERSRTKRPGTSSDSIRENQGSPDMKVGIITIARTPMHRGSSTST